MGTSWPRSYDGALSASLSGRPVAPDNHEAGLGRLDVNVAWAGRIAGPHGGSRLHLRGATADQAAQAAFGDVGVDRRGLGVFVGDPGGCGGWLLAHIVASAVGVGT